MKTRNKMIIQKIQTKINSIDSEAELKKLPLHKALEAEFDRVFDSDKALQGSLKTIDDSDEYTFNECGEVYSFIRIDRNLIDYYKSIAGALDQLERYLADYNGLVLDTENECILSCMGSYIAINDKGEVYEFDICGKIKWITTQDEYKTVKNRNLIIESHMEKTGEYNGVFKIDSYGMVTRVNTQERS